MLISRRRIWLLCLFAASCMTANAQMAEIGVHPTSPLAAIPNLHSLKAFDGKIYMGYGGWNDYAPNIIASYAPQTNTFRLEHSTASDALDLFRVVDGKLYAPSVDPVHYEDFRDFSFYTPGVGWRDMAPIGSLHVFDAAQVGGAIFLSGARESSTGAPTSLFRSIDGGRNWTAVGENYGNRLYWCFAFGNRLWTQDGYYEGTSYVSSTALRGFSTLYKPTTLADGLAIAISGRFPGLGTEEIPTPAELISFDGTMVRTLRSEVIDFAVDGGTVYLLTADAGLLRVTNLTAGAITTTPTGIANPEPSRALEILDGIVYVASGPRLFAAKLSKEPYNPGTATVVNELPDSFGRGLAFNGSKLIVGAPDASSAVPLSGKVEIWTAPDALGGLWQKAAELQPPAPDYSGWFGKDVATQGDLLAIVETGFDDTPGDRGSSARVHVYQLLGSAWTTRATLTIPYAHSVAFSTDKLYVGTANANANLPGVRSYRLERDVSNLVTVAADGVLSQRMTNGYQPVSRVLCVENRVVAGFAGDPGRSDGVGNVHVWGNGGVGESYVFNGNNRFGYALAGDGKRLAIGTPRDNGVARNAGKVEIYEWGGSAYVLKQTIRSPFSESNTEFGTALAMKGNKLLVGAPGATKDGQVRSGAVCLYAHNGTQWVLLRELNRPLASKAEFGIEVAIGDDWYAAGSRVSSARADLESRVALESVHAPNIHPALAQWYQKNGLVTPEDTLEADLDQDGLVNIVEYACGLNPKKGDVRTITDEVKAGLPRIVKDPSRTDGSLLVTYGMGGGDSYLAAIVEAGDSPKTMVPAAVTQVSTEVSDAFIQIKTVRVTPPVPDKQFFVRVRYSYP